MLLKSLKFGIIFFIMMSIINIVLKDPTEWYELLFGTVIGTIIFYAFQKMEKKEEQKEL